MVEFASGSSVADVLEEVPADVVPLAAILAPRPSSILVPILVLHVLVAHLQIYAKLTHYFFEKQNTFSTNSRDLFQMLSKS